jgi:hypothetical protein
MSLAERLREKGVPLPAAISEIGGWLRSKLGLAALAAT